MANQKKVGKIKVLMRSGREKAHNASIRQQKIARARKRHVKNTERYNEYAARQLEKYYAKNPNPGTKVGHRERK